MSRVLLITALLVATFSSVRAEEPAVLAPVEPTWDIELVNCPLRSAMLLCGDGVTCNAEMEAAMPTFVDDQGHFMFKGHVVTFSSKQGTLADVLKAFVEQNDLYRLEKHEKYGYQVIPKYLNASPRMRKWSA